VLLAGPLSGEVLVVRVVFCRASEVSGHVQRFERLGTQGRSEVVVVLVLGAGVDVVVVVLFGAAFEVSGQ
jgi:hypothetical protein